MKKNYIYRNFINKNKSLKIIFAGTPNFSAKHLKSLIFSHHKIVFVLTQPDKKSGRGKKIKPTPVKSIALRHAIPIVESIEQIKKIKKSKFQTIDLMITVAYGNIIPISLIKKIPYGCINMHPSLLPRWRGANPIQYSILKKDKITGVTSFYMNKKIDAGRIIHTTLCKIDSTETTASLIKKILPLSINTMFTTLKKILCNPKKGIKQKKSMITYSKKIKKNQGKIDWSKTAKIIELHVRAFNPYPTSYFIFNNEHIKLWKCSIFKKKSCKKINKKKEGEIIFVDKKGIKVKTGKNTILNLIKIQSPGKKIILAYQWYNTQKIKKTINAFL